MTTTGGTKAELSRFPSPFAVPSPSGCEGWQEMYPFHVVFDEGRREFEERRFWFREALHISEPLHPFDAIAYDSAVVALNQASARLFVVPPSLGVEYRVLNGYVYVSTSSVDDEAMLARRTELFAQRGGHYYRHWDELYERWVQKVEAATDELKRLDVPKLPEFEDEEIVTTGRGTGSSHALLLAYDALLEAVDRIFQFHFEFLNLGYDAYLVFYDRCRAAFPDITDQTVAMMVSGIDVLVFRPDDELRRLARLAVELGVGDAVKGAEGEDDLAIVLAGDHAGERWLESFEATKDPWFYVSSGAAAFQHHHSAWIDDLSLPIGLIGAYITRLDAGEDISRSTEPLLAERERVTDEYRVLLADDVREGFDQSLALARRVFPYVEDHNFYIDHRYMTIFWNKVREFGELLAEHRFLADTEDVFFLRHDEVRAALCELRLHWSSGGTGVARGPAHWPKLVERRRTIYERLSRSEPPPALGPVPTEITDPTTIMLWGITIERLREWLSADADGTCSGCPASPGTAEGFARVLLRSDELDQIEDGEILVAPATSASWTPVFNRIAAAVLDTGGIMCHAAIVAREYGLPAVVGTGTATQRIKTGDRIRVDANAGTVTTLPS